MEQKFKPLGDRILVESDPAVETTKSGLIIPEISKNKPLHGTVIDCGPGSKDSPLTIKKGDRIVYGEHSGTKIKLNDKEYLVMRESEAFGITG